MNEESNSTDQKSNKLENSVNPLFAILVLFISIGIFFLVFWNFTSLPKPLTLEDEVYRFQYYIESIFK